MKVFFNPTVVILFSILLFTCQQNEITPKGEFEFSFSLEQASNGRLTSDVNDAYAILVSIDRINGTNVLNREQIALFNFDGTFITEPIALEVGTYLLTEFLVLDESGNVIFATPKKESELENFILAPLPIQFDIAKDLTNKITLSVLGTQSLSARDFGYQTMSFSVLPTFDFNVSVFVYDELTQNFELTDALFLVKADQDTLLKKNLLNQTNRITLKEEISTYELIIQKANYTDFRKVVSRDFLKLFQDSVYIVKLFNNVDLTEGLVAYYPFNGNTNDESGNNLDGQLLGPLLTTDKYGIINSAYHFDGIDDRIEIPNNYILEPQNYSLSAWIKAELDTGAIISFSNISPRQNNSGYYMSILDGKMRGSSNIGMGNWTSNISDETLNLNTWNHLTFTFDGQILTLFINGLKVKSQTVPHTVNYSEHSPIQIGVFASTLGGTWFSGILDEIRIYNRALDENEVYALSESF